jgi:hypothetical protein
VLHLKQNNWLEEDTDKAFVLGAQEIDVRLETYNTVGGYALARFSPVMPAGQGIFSIKKIVPHFANNDALVSGRYDVNYSNNPCVTTEVYVEQGDSFVKKTSNVNGYEGLIASEPCWIVVNLYPDPVNKCTPALDYLEVKYTTL